ncbi:hypothetical protein HY030_01045 [Candidatus Gottesmanbacteria bacterium]|nr:hypothetical protein [Candidatus Gottesmanbacteria bacterium]
MKFILSDDLIKKYGNIKLAFGAIKNVNVFGPNEQTKNILENVYPLVREKYIIESLRINPNSIAYINFAKKIGIDPESAFLPHLQIKRVLTGKSIGNINNIVNEYMALELLYNLSLSAYDLDLLKGNLVAEVAAVDEDMIAIGGQTFKIPLRDFTLSDEKGAFYSFSQGYRDSSKITTKTKNVLFVIDAPNEIENSEVENCLKDLLNKFNSQDFFLLNENVREVNIT